MTALLIVLASLGTYLAIGATYGRSRTVDCYRRAREEWSSGTSRGEKYAMESVRWMVAWRIAFWPWAMVFDLIRQPVASFLVGPIDERRDRARQLREDAAAWRAKRHEGTLAERQMADELARLCARWADEVDL